MRHLRTTTTGITTITGVFGAAALLLAVNGCDAGAKDEASAPIDMTAQATAALPDMPRGLPTAEPAAAKVVVHGADSPQAAFDTISRAAKDQDHRTYFSMIAREQQDKMLAGMILGAAITLAPVGTKPNPDKQKAFAAILSKHGLDSVASPSQAPGAAQGLDKLTSELQTVKDRPGLFDDLMRFLEKNSLRKKRQHGKALENLKVTGEAASGTAVLEDQHGKVTREPITFRMEGGRWVIEQLRWK